MTSEERQVPRYLTHYFDYGENWQQRGMEKRYETIRVDDVLPVVNFGIHKKLMHADAVFHIAASGEFLYSKNRHHGQDRPQTPEEIEKLTWQILQST